MKYQKMSFLHGPHLEGKSPHRLAGENLQKSTREPYLEISLTVQGVDPTATLEKVEKADKRLKMMNGL